MMGHRSALNKVVRSTRVAESACDDEEMLRRFQGAVARPVCRDCGFIEVVSGHRPLSGVIGGDFFESLRMDESRDILVMGDVTGHGVRAAIVMAMVYGAVRQAARNASIPCDILAGLNEMLLDLSKRAEQLALFSATLFVAILNSDGLLNFSGAGHPPAFLLRRGGLMEQLPSGMPPLGFDVIKACANHETHVLPGERLLIYTDGLLTPERSPVDLAEVFRSAVSRSMPDHVVNQLITQGDEDDRTAAIITFRGVEARV
jgi:serine phosphatase RsbU (regulator of sigma subunit)